MARAKKNATTRNKIQQWVVAMWRAFTSSFVQLTNLLPLWIGGASHDGDMGSGADAQVAEGE